MFDKKVSNTKTQFISNLNPVHAYSDELMPKLVLFFHSKYYQTSSIFN